MNSFKVTITDFINHCKFEKNLSEKTIKAYSIDLAQFSAFLLEKNFESEISKITKLELRAYLEVISPLKPKTIKRKIATLKATFNFLEYEDRIVINPFRKMRIKITEAKVLPKVMDIKEITKIFKSAYQNKSTFLDESSFSFLSSLRDIAVIELLFATGARVSEIANLKTENINLNSGIITIKGKGNKERIIQICNSETIGILKEYYRNFKQKIQNSGGNFLINRLGNKISDQSIRGIVRNLTKNAKINRNITPHVFRHSFATLLLEKDVDIKYIQSLLGHSTIMTTQIYTHVNRKKQRQIIKTKHPRRDFSMLI